MLNVDVKKLLDCRTSQSKSHRLLGCLTLLLLFTGDGLEILNTWSHVFRLPYIRHLQTSRTFHFIMLLIFYLRKSSSVFSWSFMFFYIYIGKIMHILNNICNFFDQVNLRQRNRIYKKIFKTEVNNEYWKYRQLIT